MYVLNNDVKTIISDIKNIHIATLRISIFWKGVPVALGSYTPSNDVSCLHQINRPKKVIVIPIKIKGILDASTISPQEKTDATVYKKTPIPIDMITGDQEL
tara:strand:- start:1078 stop:1380 length:303 start_codon:yes stop_codon:yes gene_type:complete